ncbi:VWA domain-containing protein [Methylophilaceae bacterium]|nr:VWA domain-containing protein [Methylophilaceae bacterium]
MIKIYTKLRQDTNLLLLFLTTLCLSLALINPSIPVTRNIFNYIFIVDISQSMNTKDMTVGLEKVSRIDYTKATLRKVLARLPCESKVSIGMFAGVSVAATYTPIEVCENFSAINSTIDNLDWRSTWSGNTRIRESMVNLARLIRSFPESAQVIYFTDGEEAPKLHVFNTRDLTQFQGGNDWLLAGVGTFEGTAIPKYDNKNQLIGYWSNESFALQPGMAQISQGNIGARNDYVASGASDRYLSRLDEKYLIDLSKEIKGRYVRATDEQAVLDAMGKQKPAWRDQSQLPLRHILILFALVIFLIRFISLNKIQRFFKK